MHSKENLNILQINLNKSHYSLSSVQINVNHHLTDIVLLQEIPYFNDRIRGWGGNWIGGEKFDWHDGVISDNKMYTAILTNKQRFKSVKRLSTFCNPWHTTVECVDWANNTYVITSGYWHSNGNIIQDQDFILNILASL